MTVYTVTFRKPGEAATTRTVDVVRQWRGDPRVHAYCGWIGAGEPCATVAEAIATLLGEHGYVVEGGDYPDAPSLRSEVRPPTIAEVQAKLRPWSHWSTP